MTDNITMKLTFHYRRMVPRRIERMSRRRQKAAFSRWLAAKIEARLLEYQGAANVGANREALEAAIQEVVAELVPPASITCEELN